MPQNHWNDIRGEAAATGANALAVAESIIGLAGFALFGGTAVARRLAERLIWGPDQHGDSCDCEHGCASRAASYCGSTLIRHHYTCHCVPPCYGCHHG